jgi:hypothetical protein
MSRRARVTSAALAAAATLVLTQCASAPPAATPSSTTPPTTAAPTATTTAPSTTTTPPPTRVHPVTAEELGPSWRPGCPATPEELRRVDLDYVGFDGQTHTGELIVHRDVVDEVIAIFAELEQQRFPIERMQNVTAYPDADDELSMRDNNTSAFNCRGIPGSSSWSWHAYGRAIDINPRMNPFIPAGEPAQPANTGKYVDRSLTEPGILHADDPAVHVFTDRGWTWGGSWHNPIDYQHFELPPP